MKTSKPILIVVAIFLVVAGTMLFFIVRAFNESDKFYEQMAEHEAKRQRAKEEAYSKALDTIQKREEAHAEFEAKLRQAWERK
jgi:flagellar basal body-associated protein FliL